MKNVNWKAHFLTVAVVVGVSLTGIAESFAKAMLDPARLGKSFATSPKLTAWGPPPLEVGHGDPDWKESVEVARGAAGQRAQLATVIVVGEHGFGSGAVISPDGWILTNYHVVGADAQSGAVTGQDPIMMNVVTCEQNGNRVSRREENLSATVYRTDPVHDLALLKLNSLPVGLAEMPYFKFAAEPATAGDPCMVVGTQGKGLPWAVRTGSIAGVYNYPAEVAYVTIGWDTEEQYLINRTRLTLVMSTCAVSGGDSGGPLLDMNGELVGLTFATPRNDSKGSVGFHIENADIREFTKSMPLHQEQTPFDPWEAGLHGTYKAQPEVVTLDAEGQAIKGLRQVLYDLDDSGTPVVRADQIYMDFARRSPKIVDALGLMPVGLWGMEKSGKFRFDLFLIIRPTDGVLVTGYPSQDGTVDEMRIDVDADLIADLIWTRGSAGAWSHTAGKGLPLVAKDRLEPLAYRVTNQMLHDTVSGGDSDASPERKP